jgi:hypothetical protein
MGAVKCGIKVELEEVFEVVFPNWPSDPRAEMIHLSYTPARAAAVVCTVRFPIRTGRAPARSSVHLAGKDVFSIKTF